MLAVNLSRLSVFVDIDYKALIPLSFVTVVGRIEEDLLAVDLVKQQLVQSILTEV